MINSTTGDLKLDTGSFEYKNLKDKNVSFSNGVSISAGTSKTESGTKDTFSVGVNYGYSNKRQTNFATVGDGTIIVRDGKTDISKLNRDVTRAQYTTVDVGLSGGIKVDSKMIEYITNPQDSYNQAKNALVKGLNDGRQTTEGLYQRVNNLIDDYGFKTYQEVRADRMYSATLVLALSEFCPDTRIVQNGVNIIRDGNGNITNITNYSHDDTARVIQFDRTGNITNDFCNVHNIDTTDAIKYGSLDYIKCNVFLGNLNSDIVKMLTDSLNMKINGPLQNEINQAIPNIIDNKGLNAADIRETACVATSLYVNLVLSGADVGKYSEYFADQVNAGNIRGKDALITPEGRKTIVASYGKELINVPNSQYNLFEKMMDNGDMNSGVIRIGNNPKDITTGHNLNLYRDNGSMYGSDVGNWKNHGKAWDDISNRYNLKYFEYIK